MRPDSRAHEADTAKTPTPEGWTVMHTMSRFHEQHGNDSDDTGIMKDGGVTGARGVDSEDGGPIEEVRSDDELLGEHDDENREFAHLEDDAGDNGGENREDTVVYKVYKRRFFGLFQLALLNIIVSWDWLSFSASSTTVSEFFEVSESSINWLSTAFLFSFVLITPLVIYTLHHGGPRPSIIASSILILLGNWIRYIGARITHRGNFGVVMLGQILTGLAQPFVLSAPTRYSDLWFTGNGRVAATALMSLANPFGGALGQLIDPFWVSGKEDVPNMVLYIAIISTIATIPSFFIPAKPPTPPTASSADPKQPLVPSLKALFRIPEFHLICIAFAIYVGLFNSISTLLNQILYPYDFSETSAGIAGGLLIIVGLVASAIASPIIDRSHAYLLAIKLLVPVVGACYLAFIWAPQTRSIAAVYTILSALGAASFSLVPVVLEYLCEITHPVSPEVTSTICWSGGQLLGGIFIVICDALRDNDAQGGRPAGDMRRALWFHAVLALFAVPFPLALGCCGRKVRSKRVEADRRAGRRRAEAA